MHRATCRPFFGFSAWVVGEMMRRLKQVKREANERYLLISRAFLSLCASAISPADISTKPGAMSHFTALALSYSNRVSISCRKLRQHFETKTP